jgi:hypothetical protein
MARNSQSGNEHTPFTQEQEDQRNTEEAAWAVRVEDYAANEKHRYDRSKAFISIGDQLDNITKVFKVLKAGGIDIGSDGDAQIAMSDAVKAAHPKP